ncbi:MAG: hypothetical protein Ta2G_00940 [Termitinemataceae bacterium]|nr:MAG: hypothetical protein Ta2G_00940 [Termitinemataceae bacterium]
MRFRKSIGIAKGVKLNLSKGGLSLTGKLAPGLSLSAGSKGVYLNTGIAGTGLYDRVKLFGSANSDNIVNVERAQNDGVGTEIQHIPYKKTFGGFTSFFIWIVIFVAGILTWISAKNDYGSLQEKLKLLLPCATITAAFFALWLQNKIKYNNNKKLYQAKLQDVAECMQKILDLKISQTKNTEGFADAKIFALDYQNIIAFSKTGSVLFWAPQFESDKKAQGVSVDAKTLKVTQEISAGDCYAHFLTQDFDTNKIDIYLGTAHGKQELDAIRVTYNEIKEMFSIAKKSE